MQRHCSVIISVIIRGPKIFPLSGTFFRKTEKAENFLEILFFQRKKSKKAKKFFKKFLSARGSKSLPLTVFLVEKTEPNYDTGNNRLSNYLFGLILVLAADRLVFLV